MPDLLGNSFRYWNDKCQTFLVLVSVNEMINVRLFVTSLSYWDDKCQTYLVPVSVNGVTNVRLSWY